MKWLGYKRIRVASIRCEAADIRRRMKAKHVVDLAADVEQSGGELINALVVRAGTNALLCGRDRLAASMLNKAKSVWAHVLDCDDQEAKERELAENIYRRADNRTELIAELTKLRENAIWAEQQAARGRGEKVSDAPKDSPKAQARKEVARAAGVSTAAVRKAEERAAKSAEQAENGPVDPATMSQDPPPLPEGFDTFDLEVDAFEAKKISLLHTQLRGWEVTLNKLLTELARLDGTATMSGVYVDRIREALRGAGHAVREAMPASLCFYCKGKPDEVCVPCDRFGWVGRHGGENVPKELKLRGAAARVAVNGKFVPIGGAENARQAAAPARRGKSIKVHRDDGTVVDLDAVGGDDDDAVAFG